MPERKKSNKPKKLTPRQAMRAKARYEEMHISPTAPETGTRYMQRVEEVMEEGAKTQRTMSQVQTDFALREATKKVESRGYALDVRRETGYKLRPMPKMTTPIRYRSESLISPEGKETRAYTKMAEEGKKLNINWSKLGKAFKTVIKNYKMNALDLIPDPERNPAWQQFKKKRYGERT